MAFHVGQKVVCVNDEPFDPARDFPPVIKAGQIYTIAWLGEMPWVGDRWWGMGVRLVGIDRGPDGHGREEYHNYPFSVVRFRPVVEKKTDISIFTAMLNPSRQPQTVG